MYVMRRSPVLRTLVTPLTLVTFLSACSSWGVMKDPVAFSIPEEQPDKVRVTTADDGQLILNAPKVENDTLSGIIPGTQPVLGTVSYPVEDVAAVEAFQRSPHGDPTWVATDLSLEQLCAGQTPQLRLTLTDDRVVVIGSPRIETGQIVGTTLENPFYPRMQIPLTEVTRVEKYKGDKTGLTVAIIVGAAALVAITAIAMSGLNDALEGAAAGVLGGGGS